MCTDDSREAGAAAPDTAAPGSAAEALALVRAGLGYLAAARAAELTGEEQAGCLRGLAVAESMHVAATARVLAAFSSGLACEADGQRSTGTWLRWQTRITSAAAGVATGWMRRLQNHPHIAAALAAGQVSVSYARELCDWTDRLGEHRDAADSLLLGAAGEGLGLAGLRGLAEEIISRAGQPDRDDGDDGFARRRLRLTRHFRGHAKLDGDLTPAAAAALRAVLDSMSARAGPEDERTEPQRDHDALEEVCRRLIAGGLPGRAGQPARIQLQMTLSQLLGLPERDPAAAAWIAAHGAAAPPGADCDAAITPIVTGTIDDQALGQIAAAFAPDGDPVDLADGTAGSTSARAGNPGTATCSTAEGTSADGGAGGACGRPGATAGTTPGAASCADARATGSDSTAGWTSGTQAMAQRAARLVTIAQAVRLLSGPAGLAAWLRGSRLCGPAATISLPLDIGDTAESIPPHLRRAIARRDQRCRFPGCEQRPVACHVHHLVPRSEGGATSLAGCCLLCPFHHLIAIHRWGWKLVLNADGTTTATSPDGRRVWHSHAPPDVA